MNELRRLYAERLTREAETNRIWREHSNTARSQRRRQLYRDDPIWRLTKLKDSRERRLRAKLG